MTGIGIVERIGPLKDVQNEQLAPSFAIAAVGVCDLLYPFQIAEDSLSFAPNHQAPSATVPVSVQGRWTLHADLAGDRRGTHMSRYIAALDRFVTQPASLAGLHALATDMARMQDATSARVTVDFTYFQRVYAPVSRISSLLDHQVTWSAETGLRDAMTVTMRSAATALCPCSKAISERGAHNQRAYITASLTFAPDTTNVPTLSGLAELLTSSASAQVYPLLKREDEKLLTEKAYDHPQFVEDTCREVARRLADVPGLRSGQIDVRNEESIHNHACFARIVLGQPHGSRA